MKAGCLGLVLAAGLSAWAAQAVAQKKSPAFYD
jgi:hypothetical protein